jgi:hypothetical protein
MSSTKWLSRKVILSASLMIIATLFIIWSKGADGMSVLCTQYQYLWVMSATLLPFLAANALQEWKNVSFDYLQRSGTPAVWDLIKELFGTVFLLAYLAIIGVSALNYFHIINSEIWFPIVTAIAGFYNIGNALGKLNPPAGPEPFTYDLRPIDMPANLKDRLTTDETTPESET